MVKSAHQPHHYCLFISPLSFIGYIIKESIFIKAVVGFCLNTMQILLKKFKKYVALNQIVDF